MPESAPIAAPVLRAIKHVAQIHGWLPGKPWDYAVVYGNDLPQDRHLRHAVEKPLLLTAALGIPAGRNLAQEAA